MVVDGENRILERVGRAVFPLLLTLILAAPLVITSAVDLHTAKWFIIQVGGTGLFLIWFALGTRRRERLVRWEPISVFAVFFLATQIASLAAATRLLPGLEVISRQLGLLAVFFLVANCTKDARDRDRILWTVAMVGAATAVYGIAQHWGYDFFRWQIHREVPVTRGVSFFGHATFAGSALIIIIPLTIGLGATRSDWRGRIVSWIFVLLMLYHLSFSGARIATVGLFVSALVTVGVLALRPMLERRNARPAHGPSKGVVGAVLSLVVVIAIGSVLLFRAWDVKDSDLFAIRQPSLAQRLFTWETASRMFVDNPIIGVGVGNFSTVSPPYWNAVESTRYARHARRPFEVHNEYLEVAVEQGLPGIAALLGLVAFGLAGSYGLAMRSAGRLERKLGLAYFAALVATSIDSTVTYTLQVPGSALLVWVLLGLIAFGLHSRKNAAEE